MNKQKNKRPKLVRFINFLLILITVVGAVALALSYMASWISPESSTLIAMMGLPLFPLIILNMLTALWWMFRRRVWMIVPLLVVLVGVGRVGDFYQLRFTRGYELPDKLKGPKGFSEDDVLNVATYNVHSFAYASGEFSYEAAMDSVSSFLQSQGAQIICLQEYTTPKTGDVEHFNERFANWPHQYFFAISNYGVRDMGMAVMSQFPLRNVVTHQFQNTGNAMMSADVVLERGDTLKLYNAHLQSTEFNRSQPQGLTALVEGPDAEEAIVAVERLLARNFIKRTHQAHLLREQLDSLTGRNVVVMGDFNDTPNSYVTSTVRGEDFSDSFREAGSGYGYSYRPMKHLFRIDYVLYRDTFFEAIEYNSPNIPFSDHKPVVVRLLRKNENN